MPSLQTEFYNFDTEKTRISLAYFYPLGDKGSFHLVAKHQIEQLRKRYIVQEFELANLFLMSYYPSRNYVFHPLGYPFVSGTMTDFEKRFDKVNRMKRQLDTLIGFDTADSDAISPRFVQFLNIFDMVGVPSNFAKKAFLDSGVETRVEVIPHGIPYEFHTPNTDITNPTLRQLLNLKQRNGLMFVLFFLLHSGFRKGADIVARAMKIVQSRHPNVVLVVKTKDVLDPYMGHLTKTKMVHVRGFLDYDELRQLYDLCDIVVVPSRGGGFEMNALEGAARGKPTIVPRAGCFLDYIDYVIPVEAPRTCTPLPGNEIHVGKGWETTPELLAKKIIEVAEHYEEYSTNAKKNRMAILQNYSWNNIGKKLLKMFKDIVG